MLGKTLCLEAKHVGTHLMDQLKKTFAERTCHLCNVELGDEYHYLFSCKSFNQERTTYLKPYYRHKPSTYKMHELMNSRNVKILKNLSTFAEIIMKQANATNKQ